MSRNLSLHLCSIKRNSCHHNTSKENPVTIRTLIFSVTTVFTTGRKSSDWPGGIRLLSQWGPSRGFLPNISRVLPTKTGPSGGVNTTQDMGVGLCSPYTSSKHTHTHTSPPSHPSPLCKFTDETTNRRRGHERGAQSPGCRVGISHSRDDPF